MEPQVRMILRVLRRLRTAVGYHELGMTQHALSCLDSLASLGSIGHFGLVADVLRNEFVRNATDQVCVANALEAAACQTPTPARYMIEMTLTACYGPFNETGRSAANTRSPRLSKTSQPTDGAGEADEAPVLPYPASYNRDVTYNHTQHGRWHYLRFAVALLLFGGAIASQPSIMALSLVIAAILVFCGLAFATLTIRDEGDCLALRFGPLPGFPKRIRYADITGVEIDRTKAIDRWGIHFMPGRGWTYNILGFDCVKLTLGRKTIRVGTDDAKRLATFLGGKIGLSGLSVSGDPSASHS